MQYTSWLNRQFLPVQVLGSHLVAAGAIVVVINNHPSGVQDLVNLLVAASDTSRTLGTTSHSLFVLLQSNHPSGGCCIIGKLTFSRHHKIASRSCSYVYTDAAL